MSRIRNLKFDKVSGTAEWSCDGQQVQPQVRDFEQAMEDSVNDRVFALQRSSGLPQRLYIYSAAGDEIASLGPPEGFQFYYLTAYPKLGVAVVSVAPEPVDGWRDWHFGFDPKGKKLFRHAPAY